MEQNIEVGDVVEVIVGMPSLSGIKNGNEFIDLRPNLCGLIAKVIDKSKQTGRFRLKILKDSIEIYWFSEFQLKLYKKHNDIDERITDNSIIDCANEIMPSNMFGNIIGITRSWFAHEYKIFKNVEKEFINKVIFGGTPTVLQIPEQRENQNGIFNKIKTSTEKIHSFPVIPWPQEQIKSKIEKLHKIENELNVQMSNIENQIKQLTIQKNKLAKRVSHNMKYRNSLINRQYK